MARHEAERLAALARTGLSEEPDEALERFARMVRTALRVPTALVSLVDDTRQYFPGAVGLSGHWAVERATPLTHSVCRYVVASASPLVVPDIRQVETLRESLAIPDLGVVAYAGIPLTDERGRVLGSLCAIDGEPRAWTDDEVLMLADLAAACSSELRLRLAVDDAARAGARADVTARRLTLAAEVTALLSASLDVTAALDQLTGLLVPAFADWAVVSLLDEEDGIGAVAHAHRDGRRQELAAYAAALTDPGVASPTRLVLAGEAAILRSSVPDPAADRLSSPALAQAAEELGCRSYVVAPLSARGRTLGAIRLSSSTDRAFGLEDLDLVVDLGIRAGLAIDNGRLYAGQRRVAEALQRSMLTRLPEPDHLEIVSRYRASADDAQIGGDWYDAFLQPDGATVLVIGDVMGHDISAAGAMGQIRNLLRGTAYDRGDEPARVLQRVDAALRGLDVAALATCVVARIEQSPEQAGTGDRTLRWSNAGHPPPLLLHPDGSVVLLDRDEDLMLGVDPRGERRDHVVPLPAGSVLLLFTDGLVEHRLLPVADGLAALQELLAGRVDEPLDQLCDAVLDAAVSPHTSDDVALVAVRVHAEDAPRPAAAGPTDVPLDRPTV